MVQVLFQPELPTRERFRLDKSGRTDNVTIVGMTLTGTLYADPIIGGSSVAVSNPGSVRLVNCLWKDMVAPGGIVFVGTNYFQEMNGMAKLQVQDASLTIVNSTARNIERDGVFLEASEQSLTLQGCQFQDIRLLASTTQCDDRGKLWCQGFLYCLDQSICRLEDLCIENFEFAGAASVLAFTNDSQVTLSGTHFIHGLSHFPAAAADVETCSSGMAEVDTYGRPIVCLESEDLANNWTAAASCPLD